jgi:hypothetical protein
LRSRISQKDKDGGPLARADIGKPAIGLRGIDLAPIDIEQLIKDDLCRVVGDFD